jgi:hypothetical protein
MFGLGFGAAQASEPVVLAHVVWSKTPSWEDVAKAFAGTPAGEAGRVVLQCQLNGDGALRACALAPGASAGDQTVQAARRLIPRFRVNMDTLTIPDLDPLRIRVAFEAPAPGASSPPPIVSPDWTKVLPEASVQEVFPARAADAGVTTGRASLDCVVNGSGAMTECQVKSEEPPDMDFGLAAMRVASAMAVSTWTDEGFPAEGAHVKFAIRLNKAGSPPAS